MDLKERINEILATQAEPPYDLSAQDIAMELVDQDVSAGEYEGCSSELEMAYEHYMNVVQAMLAEGF